MDHPLTPPPRLVEELQDLGNLDAIQLAYQAGADYELEACCEWLDDQGLHHVSSYLCAVRRPKPPSLKEQALESLTKIEDNKATYLDASIVRRALEALPND